MIILTNGQASAFNSNVIANLFSDQSRHFPTGDAFRLSDTIQQIQARLPAYKASLKKIITENGGIVQDSGLVSYPGKDQETNAQKQVDELNAIEIKVPAEKITPGSDWPRLSLAEATILRPLLNGFEE